MTPQTSQRAIEIIEWCLLSAVGIGVVITLVLGMAKLVEQAF